MNRVLSIIVPLAVLLIAVAYLVQISMSGNLASNSIKPVKIVPGEYRGMTPEQFIWHRFKRTDDVLNPDTMEPMNPFEEVE